MDEAGAAPRDLPAPGVVAARRPLAWGDTLAIDVLGDPGAQVFGLPLASVRGVERPTGRAGTRAVVSLAQGSDAWDENGLMIERADSVSAWRYEAATGSRGVTRSLGDGARHLWGVSGRMERGSHRLTAAFGQRSAGGHLPGGLEQTAAGESGALAWRWESGSRWGALRVARGDDHHESAGDTLEGSRRDAGETRVEGEAGRAMLGGSARIAAGWSDARVARTLSGRPAFEAGARAAWLSARLDRALARGRLEAALAGGHHDGAGRTVVEPWAAYVFDLGRGTARVAVGRLTAPVWCDLAPGQGAFLQSTWAAASQWRSHGAGPVRTHGFVLGGRTTDLAIVRRLPLEDLWLRSGARAEQGSVRFVMAAGGAEWTRGSWSAGVEGFSIGRDRGSEPRVDPRWGTRVTAAWSSALFEGDLGVLLCLDAEALGARVSEGPARRPLPAFASLGASCAVTLADARFVLEGRNLEDRAVHETWIDPSTGDPARGPGRQIRLMLTWKLYN